MSRSNKSRRWGGHTYWKTPTQWYRIQGNRLTRRKNRKLVKEEFDEVDLPKGKQDAWDRWNLD